MKAKQILSALALALLAGAASAQTKTTGSVISSIASKLGVSTSVTNAITSALGVNDLKAEELIGTWNYSGAGVAFTSDEALAAAGGEVVASEITEQLEPYYTKLGLTSSNTYYTFTDEGKYTAKIAGKSLSGTYTFDEETQALTMKVLLVNITAYTKRNGTGIAILFDADKLLTLFRTIAKISGNDTLSAISSLSENYDGLRLGFNLDAAE